MSTLLHSHSCQKFLTVHVCRFRSALKSILWSCHQAEGLLCLRTYDFLLSRCANFMRTTRYVCFSWALTSIILDNSTPFQFALALNFSLRRKHIMTNKKLITLIWQGSIFIITCYNQRHDLQLSCLHFLVLFDVMCDWILTCRDFFICRLMVR